MNDISRRHWRFFLFGTILATQESYSLKRLRRCGVLETDRRYIMTNEESKMNPKKISTVLTTLALLAILLTACASATPVPPTPTPLIFVTSTPLFNPNNTAVPVVSSTPAVSDFTAIPGLTSTTSPSSSPSTSTNVCADPQATALIDSLKKA